MRHLPKKLKQEILADDYYRRCCLTYLDNKDTKIDWHHAWEYAGKQINEKWAIMPVCWRKHSPLGDEDSVHNCKKTDEYVKYLSLLRADLNDLQRRYPKKDWQREFDYLKSRYEKSEISKKSPPKFSIVDRVEDWKVLQLLENEIKEARVEISRMQFHIEDWQKEANYLKNKLKKKYANGRKNKKRNKKLGRKKV